MKIKYTEHALRRMKERRIERSLIEEAILRGQKREQQEDEKTKCVYIKDRDKLIVIYKQLKEIYQIITAYYED